MAEVLGLIAACCQILDIVNRTSSSIRDKIHRSSSAKLELVTLLGRLTAYEGLCRGIKLEAEYGEAEQMRLSALAHLMGPLDICTAAVKQISERIATLPTRFLIEEIIDSNTRRALKCLDGLRPVLELALHADQW